MLNQDTVREATRLTRGGQLVEATALLQRMLRGEREPTPASRSAAQAPLPRLEPPTIDAKADVVEERKSRQPTPVQGRTRPAPLVGMRKFSGLGLRAPIGRAPPSTSDIVPDGTKFIAGTFSNAAGACFNHACKTTSVTRINATAARKTTRKRRLCTDQPIAETAQ